MTIGFVYMLKNDSMPGLYKVGCTERAPNERARQISGATGVPTRFEVMCYIEVEQAQRVEQRIHHKVRHLRIASNREFFSDALELAGAILHYPDRLTEYEAWSLEELRLEAGFDKRWMLHDPWEINGGN